MTLTKKRLVQLASPLLAAPLLGWAGSDLLEARAQALKVPALEKSQDRTHEELQQVRRDLTLLLINMYRTTAYNPELARQLELRLNRIEAERDAQKEVKK